MNEAISAAPELYAVLKRLVGQLMEEDDLRGPELRTCQLCGGINDYHEADCEVGLACAAIAKAEGRTS